MGPMEDQKETESKPSVIDNALNDLQSTTTDVEHQLARIMSQLRPVLTEMYPDSDSAERAVVHNHASAISDVRSRISEISIKLSHILKNLEV